MEREAKTIIGADGAGSGLLDYLARRFSYLDRAAWEQAVREERVTRNGAPAEAGAVLAAGDLVRFAPEPFEEPETDGRFRIVYEDERLLVVDKPPNLPVHPGGRYFAGTLWYLLRARYPEARVATRLDRETSGLALVAKDAAEARRLHALQRDGLIEKSYLALVRGAFPAELDAAGILVPDEGSPVRKKRAFVGSADPRFAALSVSGESCRTLFSLERSGGGKSLVRARLLTGRTHQIRATLRSLGYPVVGDKLYGPDDALFLRFIDGRLDERDREILERDSQALHCARLSLPGFRGTTITTEAPCPFDI